MHPPWAARVLTTVASSGGASSAQNGIERPNMAKQEFWAGFSGSLAGGVLTAAVVASAGIALSERVAEASAYLNPTCDSPRGLRPIPTTDVEAQGPTIKIDDNGNGKPDYPANRVLDGYEGSAWMPPIASKKDRPIEFRPVFVEGENVLTLKLIGPRRDIKLICVNNALGASIFAYENWGKARTVVFWVGDQEPDRGKVSVLKHFRRANFNGHKRLQTTSGSQPNSTFNSLTPTLASRRQAMILTTAEPSSPNRREQSTKARCTPRTHYWNRA